jgi:pimeloyl-ACP methyl ester carboxylesterase
MQTSHFVRNGELTTAYQEAGDGAPFVLLHGFTGSKLDFQDQLTAFAALRRTIAYDQRGHGETSNQQPYTFDALVDDLIGLLDVLDIPQCDLLGHSLGGMVAMRAALAHPGRFRSLILMDTAPAPLELWPRRARRKLAKVVTRHGFTSLLDGMRQATPTPGQQRGIDHLGEAEHWRRIAVKLEQMDPQAFVDLSDALSTYPPLVDRLAEIRCPTTVIVGELDAPFLEPSRLMANTIVDATLTTVPLAEHSPQYENEPAWCKAVRDHLQRCGS